MDPRQMPSRDEAATLVLERREPTTLGDYVWLVWGQKIVVVGAAVVAGATMFAMSIRGPRVYESTVTLAASQSKIGEGNQSLVASTANFRPMIESLTTAARVLHDVGLDKPGQQIRPAEFLDHVMALNEVRGTNLMRVTIVYTDPAMAARMANSVADHAVRVARSVSAAEAVHGRDMIKQQVDLARERLAQADTQLKEFRQKTHVEAIRRDVEALLLGGGSLMDLLLSIAGQKAKIARLEQELAARQKAGASVLDLLGSIGSEKAQLARMQQDVASRDFVEPQKTTRGGSATARLGEKGIALLDHLYELESEVSRRQIERDLAERLYTDISQRYEIASLQVVGRSAELSIIDPAVPPDRPVSRQVARNTVVAAMIGFFFGIAGVLLWHTGAQILRVPVR